MLESLGLKFDKFIRVDSTPLHAAEKLGKLHTLLITKQNEHLTVPKWQIFKRGEEPKIAGLFGKASVFDFAKNYFAFQNKAGDFADRLFVYTMAGNSGQAAALVGGDTPSLDELKKINGSIKITIDSTEKDVVVNFTNKTTHTEMATALAEAIKKDNGAVAGFKDANVTWSSIYNAFVITAGQGAKVIQPAGAPTSGTDVSTALGLGAESGARTVDAYSKVDTLRAALDEIATRNDSYFFVTLDYELNDFINEVLPAAEWVDDSRGQYCFVYCSSQKSLLTQPTYTARLHNYNGLLIEYTPNLRVTNGRSLGLFSSVDYSKPQGNLAFTYNKVPSFLDYSIKKEDEYDILTDPEKNRSNGYVTVRRLTSGYTWYMPGNIMGIDTLHLNVYTGNFVITTLLQQGFAMWLTNNKFPSVSDSVALQLYTNSVMQDAVNKGLITTVDSLETDEIQQLSTIFTHGTQATQAILASGFYTEIADFDPVARCINIKIAYVANVPIRRLCIKLHALRG